MQYFIGPLLQLCSNEDWHVSCQIAPFASSKIESHFWPARQLQHGWNPLNPLLWSSFISHFWPWNVH